MQDVRQQEECIRQQALREFEDNLWLDDAVEEALKAWVGMRSDVRTISSYIHAAIVVAATTARYYKTNRRHTAFGRSMRVGRHGAIINASSLRKVVNNQKFINITIAHVPEPKSYNRRNRDMRVCGEFLDKVAAKFLATHFFAHELLKPEVFATLGLLPDELVEAEHSYQRLVRLIEAAKLLPLGDVKLGFDPSLYVVHIRRFNRRRRHCLTIGDFLAIMQAMRHGADNSRKISAQLGVDWSAKDEERLNRLKWQLQTRVYQERIDLPLGYRYE